MGMLLQHGTVLRTLEIVIIIAVVVVIIIIIFIIIKAVRIVRALHWDKEVTITLLGKSLSTVNVHSNARSNFHNTH